MVVARKDGLIEIRDWENGSTISKLKLGENLVDLLVSDFRNEGFNQLVAVLQSGLVKAYSIQEVKSNEKPSTV